MNAVNIFSRVLFTINQIDIHNEIIIADFTNANIAGPAGGATRNSG